MKTAVFIRVRTDSTRLPKKALRKIKGKPTIEHLIDRAKLANLPDNIVLSTSTNPADTALVKIARHNGIKYYRGSEKDVLKRHLGAAKKFGIDFFVNVDGDDILFAYELIDKIIQAYRLTNADYITCVGLPLGATPIGIKVKALEKVCKLKDSSDTEIFGKYFTKTGLFKVKYLKAEGDLRHPEVRLTLDYKEDFDFFKEIFKRLYKPGKIFSLKEILGLLKNNPEIMKINKGAQEKYLANINKRRNIRLKRK